MSLWSKNGNRFFNTEARRHKGTEVLMEMQIYRERTRIGRHHLIGEVLGLQQKGLKFQFLGSCKFLVEAPAVRAEFNSDGWRSRYRSAASHLPTDSMTVSHRNVQNGICDAEGYDTI